MMFPTVANQSHPVYSSLVAANSAHGLGGPVPEADNAYMAFFFVRSMAGPLWAGRAGGLRVCRFSGRSANLYGSVHPLGGGWRRTKPQPERTAMTPRRPLTLVTSSRRVRAAQHRRMALAALKLDSSLSVRLSRYWRHIERARLLERAEVQA